MDSKAVGTEMRRYRWQRELRQGVVSERMGLSPGYVCQLEHGERQWTPELIARYKKACDELHTK